MLDLLWNEVELVSAVNTWLLVLTCSFCAIRFDFEISFLHQEFSWLLASVIVAIFLYMSLRFLLAGVPLPIGPAALLERGRYVVVAQLVKAALHRTLVLFFFDDVLGGCEGLGDVEWAGRLVCDSAVIIMRQGAAAHKRSWRPSILAQWGVHQARVC